MMLMSAQLPGEDESRRTSQGGGIWLSWDLHLQRPQELGSVQPECPHIHTQAAPHSGAPRASSACCCSQLLCLLTGLHAHWPRLWRKAEVFLLQQGLERGWLGAGDRCASWASSSHCKLHLVVQEAILAAIADLCLHFAISEVCVHGCVCYHVCARMFKCILNHYVFVCFSMNHTRHFSHTVVVSFK